MNNKDSLGDRMKNNYENRAKTYLVRRMPVAIRLDGRAWHSFTKGFKRPYDSILHDSMNETMKYLCENIQGCKIGYTQSDEITLLLTDYDKLETDAWFDNNVQKMCSISASMATMKFNQVLRSNIMKFTSEYEYINYPEEDVKYIESLEKAMNKGAMFDSRCFNIPEDEVTNCFVWRQQDCTRNAIQMLGQCNFSHTELQNKSCNDIQEMLMMIKNINFNDMPTVFKRGVCCIKTAEGWILDTDIPIFAANRAYIENTFRGEDESVKNL